MAKGFWNNPRDPAEVLMLVNSELVEAYEHYRQHGEFHLHHYEVDGKPFGVPSELADVIIRRHYSNARYLCGLEY
jgi:hypothetical protein